MTGWEVWLKFFFCLALIGVSGTQLSRYGDVLAEKTGLGRTWLGLVLLAAITSLPESSTGISSVLWVNAPNISVGDLLGSCLFNLFILAVVDLLYPSGPVLTAADRGHLLAGSFAVVMLTVTVMGTLAPLPTAGITIGYIGLSSPILLVCYLGAMRVIYRYQRRERLAYLQKHQEALLYAHIGLGKTVLMFGLGALVVVGAGIWIPRIAVDLASIMGWRQTLVGTIFVAISTSLPELVVTLGALRLGAVDLAVGNLLGSNLVNLALLGVMDILYFKGPLLRAVSPDHASTGLMAILMTSIVCAELVYRPPKKALRLVSLGAFLLAFLFTANIFLQMLTK
jgi:cation:H+ antiporter|uniref:Sodium:calcium antiporter n=1 Tax=Desulfobacca acetoxidans TaxID=60893 RepID=A0A7V6A2N5_9BACT